MDRRRLASLMALLVAASATLATSQPAPTPAATIKESLDGHVELTADAPIAVQEFHVRVNGAAVSKSGTPTVQFAPSAILATSDEEEQVRIRIVAGDATTTPTQIQAFRSTVGEASAQQAWRLTCPAADACEGRFGLIVEWADPASTANASVDWHLEASIGVWTGEAAGSAIVDFATEARDAVARPAITIETAEGAAVRMDATHHLAQWRVTMSLADGSLAGAPTWPHLVTAHLTPRSTVVTPPNEGNQTQPCPFIDGPGDFEQTALYSDYPYCTGGAEFEPFYACVPDEECTVEYLVGLQWLDWRLETEVDAGWDLDIRSIGVDGTDLPVAIEVEPVPSFETGVATATGTLTWSKGKRDEYRYLVSVPPQTSDDPVLDGVRLPAYGIWRATLTSTGRTPLPKDFAINFGQHGGEARLTLEGGEKSVGFDPGACRVNAGGPCHIERNLAAGFSENGLPDGWEFTVTWKLEVGVGVLDPDTKATIVDISPSTP